MAIKNMANDYGINLHKVEFIDLLPHDQIQAFSAGELDAIACLEPAFNADAKRRNTRTRCALRSNSPAR